MRLARYALKNYSDTIYAKELAIALLLHDGTEGYVGDVIYHLKQELPQFIAVEDKVGVVINKKFNVSMADVVQKEVKSLDRRICFDEMYALFGRIDPWFYENKVAPLGMDKFYFDDQDRIGWTPQETEKKFIGMAAFLGLIPLPTSDNES